MFLESFKVTILAVAQIFLLGALGFFLVKRNILGQKGLSILSRLVIGVTLPILIFCRLLKNFSFTLYPNWWVFPLLSIVITIAGLLIGLLSMGLIKGSQLRMQFLSLVTFQNAGYLPLALVAALLPKDKIDTMFIYLFLLLLGFNLVLWSVGVYMLTFSRKKRFELGRLFSPPVIAVSFTLLFIYFGLNKFVPGIIVKPLNIVGSATLPLAMLVVGGSLAQIQLNQVNKKAIALMLVAKMLILPLLGIWLIVSFRFPELIGLLILIQLAMPPATSLSLIINHYRKEDLLVSQGVFFGHLLSIITLPVFLSLYFMLGVVQ